MHFFEVNMLCLAVACHVSWFVVLTHPFIVCFLVGILNEVVFGFSQVLCAKIKQNHLASLTSRLVPTFVCGSKVAWFGGSILSLHSNITCGKNCKENCPDEIKLLHS